ncbi:hypothetical protein QO002_005075 [Pararhizobium capsulatum DSM 1112]|uniref:Membrane-anchored protein n=2 Tax=Pararhizobium capsulatum TaxID=34014 RepID=A0ABU0BYT9_9HYPH|nr:hypothetical protein [Pararhizobium capsulatum DSM 1112]
MADTRKRMYRNIKYRLTRPAPPTAPAPFTRPVVVVGSAPVSHKPAGWEPEFAVMTINGSQSVIKSWGIAAPDITFLQFNQIEGTNTNAVEVRRVLSGKRTGALYVFLWRKDDRPRLEKGLRNFDFRYDSLQIVDRYERMALMDRVAGVKSLELDTESKCSNGMNAVLFALHNGAPAVIITGINPNLAGHAYNREGLVRAHVQMDKQIVAKLLADGRPLYTADPAVSEDMGIPLWTGMI